MFYSLILLGAFAMMFMIMNSINGIRDCMKMNIFARIAKESTYKHGIYQMFRFGSASMLFEGDTMRSSSAILGFTNGRVITPYESVIAMLSAGFCKAVWIWIAGAILLLSTIFQQIWVLLAVIGFVILILNQSHYLNIIGRFAFYIGMLLLALLIANDGMSQCEVSSVLLSYTGHADVVGLILSCFIGVFIGAIVSGNLVSIFIAMIFVLNGLLSAECSIVFVIGTEIGVLFPMSFMVSDTNFPARRSFYCYVVILLTVLVIDMLLLSIVPMPFLNNFGTFGFILGYTLLYSFMLPIVYYMLGTKIWSRVSTATHSQLYSKRHLHVFDKIYRPHVSLILIQAEKEIVNLQYRIHKMLDFIIDILDEENVEESLNHVRKYKDIVYRTGNEISNFIITQASEKTNESLSPLVKERLGAVSYQCELGNLFCDLAESVNKSDVNDKQIIRRCVVALETLFNQVTKLIDIHYSVSKSDEKLFKDDVEILSLQLINLLNEYGKETCLDVLSYTIEKSRKIVIEIIKLYVKFSIN